MTTVKATFTTYATKNISILMREHSKSNHVNNSLSFKEQKGN